MAMRRRICFWLGQGTERVNCCTIWAGDLRMLRRKRDSARAVEVLDVRREILTMMGRRTWRFAKAMVCDCFTTRVAGRLLMSRRKLEFVARPGVFRRTLW